MELSTIITEVKDNQLSPHYAYIESITMLWKGESDFIEFSQELLRDNWICTLRRFNLGAKWTFGPYQLVIIGIDNLYDKVLFKLLNQEAKTKTYIGSIENEWNWQEKQ